MDEIDIEIKKIQLQRERLALKRELARSQWAENTIGSAGCGLAYGRGAVRSGVARIVGFAVRWWKPVACLTVLAAIAVGAYQWKEVRDQDKREASIAQYRVDRETFLADSCAKNARCEPFSRGAYSCMLLETALAECLREASVAFYERRGTESPRR